MTIFLASFETLNGKPNALLVSDSLDDGELMNFAHNMGLPKTRKRQRPVAPLQRQMSYYTLIGLRQHQQAIKLGAVVTTYGQWLKDRMADKPLLDAFAASGGDTAWLFNGQLPSEEEREERS